MKPKTSNLLLLVFMLLNTSIQIQSMHTSGHAGAGAHASAHLTVSARLRTDAINRFFNQSTTTKLFKGTASAAGSAAALPVSLYALYGAKILLKQSCQKAFESRSGQRINFTEGVLLTGVVAGGLGLGFIGLWGLEASYRMAKNSGRHFREFKNDIVNFFS